jgi:hypothetical protein
MPKAPNSRLKTPGLAARYAGLNCRRLETRQNTRKAAAAAVAAVLVVVSSEAKQQYWWQQHWKPAVNDYLLQAAQLQGFSYANQ